MAPGWGWGISPGSNGGIVSLTACGPRVTAVDRRVVGPPSLWSSDSMMSLTGPEGWYDHQRESLGFRAGSRGANVRFGRRPRREKLLWSSTKPCQAPVLDVGPGGVFGYPEPPRMLNAKCTSISTVSGKSEARLYL